MGEWESGVPRVDNASVARTAMVLIGSHTEILRNQRQGVNRSYQGTY